MGLEGILNGRFVCFPRGVWPQGIVSASRRADLAHDVPQAIQSGVDPDRVEESLQALGLFSPTHSRIGLTHRSLFLDGGRGLSPLGASLLESHLAALAQLVGLNGRIELHPEILEGFLNRYIREIVTAMGVRPTQVDAGALIQGALALSDSETTICEVEEEKLPHEIRRVMQDMSSSASRDLHRLKGQLERISVQPASRSDKDPLPRILGPTATDAQLLYLVYRVLAERQELRP